ncbi:unnamed protein product [Tilletia controversa]|uniref:DUF676 domain-containing protein n=1 Tax=Tilletia controversa TaxID=13291 RepID=A0A8X7N063_9BASI|nr:hypothetical protein CF328_g3744 [Tilletia controversa]KAE8254026.1 hypothetical protein A4X06_0g1111 [Tilletia controversa]CAD6973969.1 unnamed protein product [Tilletia controversa]CAD6982168.1 unnamed protein product [Tilletia controversa]
MSGPSRLPLEALKHASRAIGTATAAAAASSSGILGSSRLASQLLGGTRNPSQSRAATLAQKDGVGPAHSPPEMVVGADKADTKAADDSDKDKKKKEEKDNKKKKTKQPKWRGAGAIGDLMQAPVLFSLLRVPRNPIVLCHGLYGFDVRGPFLGLEIQYWAEVMDILKKRLGAHVIIRGVPGTGSIQERADALHKFLCSSEAGVRGRDLNFIGHSMGGLDARHLISNIQPSPDQYRPVSLTTICTPHRGSPFMDWCNANIGIGNDAIEKALREVKEKRGSKAESSRTQSMEQHHGQQQRQEEDEVRLPYSLKSPIFVRQKKATNGEENGSRETDNGKLKATTSEEQKETTERIFERAKGKDKDEAKADFKDASARLLQADDVESGAAKVDSKKPPKESESKAAAIFGSISSAFSTLTDQFSDYMLSVLDTPAYAMLSTKYMSQVFNPSTPDSPDVKYYSIAARTRSLPMWHPLWLPKLILDTAAESRTSGGEADGSGDALGGKMQGNDGLVSVQSAHWGEFLGIVDGSDHWDLRGSGGPRLVTDKVADSSEAKKEKEEAAQGTSWIDVNQLLGLWRSFQPSPTKSNGEAQNRSGPDGMSTAHNFSTQSDSQQQQRQAEERDDNTQDAARSTSPLESLQPSPAPSKYPFDEQSGNTTSVPVATAAAGLHDSATQADSVSDIVQSFMHAYSHLADPKHEDSDYDWSSAPSFTPTSDHESIITEIAQWISDRLPERDEGRRAEAEKEAAAQDQELEAHKHGHEQALSALVTSNLSQTPVSALKHDESTQNASSSAMSTFQSLHTSHGQAPAQAPAQKQQEAGPRYRIRHNEEEEDDDVEDEEDRREGVMAAKDGSKRISRDVDELELFWLAICHHLHARGF